MIDSPILGAPARLIGKTLGAGFRGGPQEAIDAANKAMEALTLFVSQVNQAASKQAVAAAQKAGAPHPLGPGFKGPRLV